MAAQLVARMKRFVADENGATAIEYGLIAALVTIGALAAMTTFGSNLTGLFNSVSNKATTAMSGG